MIKSSQVFWQSPETLKHGSKLTVDPKIGYQLLAMYPDAFRIVETGQQQPQKRKKAVEPETLIHGSPSSLEASIV
jgi:hypothetical protein